MLIFIINIKYSIDRKKSMEQKIKDLAKNTTYEVFLESNLLNKNIQDSKESKNNKRFCFYFFDAIDAKDIESKKLIIKNYNATLSKFVRGKELGFGELACFASHYALWEKCVSLGENIIILEDDISFEDDFLDSIIKIENSKFEYVRLYYLFDRKIWHLRDDFYISYQNLSGTQGYFVSPHAALKFILHSKIWFHCVDNYMDMFFINKVQNIIYKPFCISEDEVYTKNSTILGRKKIQIKWIYKLTREISRFFLFSIYKNLYLFFYKIRGV
ncbi:glycosyltransferase family 25 protein [Helicobacter sp. MIT 99-5507]|uniref:glycosyltransferase family 25 protein n=1 Tax=Helicobacter sp. MIT 99-5507 TaxID=152489 RepID=UPI000E1E6C7A|nr:glycosyltransferase family 25 protein [Helicobacter sp. MIT 99-5507]RDU58245.1 lipooligosaccharide biosynthesis glycosyltransferase [Helicobacter sp. MIT 99-5507]